MFIYFFFTYEKCDFSSVGWKRGFDSLHPLQNFIRGVCNGCRQQPLLKIFKKKSTPALTPARRTPILAEV